MMRTGNLVALILAAGYSSRMGDFKPLLPMAGEPVIARAVHSFRAGGVTDIRVVTGHRARELTPVLSSLGVTPVFNENYHQGMFSSVLAGLDTFTKEVEGFFLLPGDMPLVKNATITRLVRQYRQISAPVIYPCFRGRRGHPPLITRACFAAIRNPGADGNLRQVLERFNGSACELACSDQGLLLDLDTPADYQKALALAGQRDIPAPAECQALWEMYQVPERIIRHGYKVAQVALVLARALHEQGYALDLALVRAGGLLHDLAKGSPGHAQKGADWLEQEGFAPVAEIVRRHTDLVPPGVEMSEQDLCLDEKALVYLADKMVQGVELIPIAARFQDAARKYGHEPQIMGQIEKRRQQAMMVAGKVSAALQITDLSRYVRDRCSNKEIMLTGEFCDV